MKVLHVHTRYRQRGGEDVVVELERRLLTESGFEVEAVDLQNPTSALPAAAALVRAPWNTTTSRKVVEAALDFEADIVHIHNTWFMLSPSVVPHLRRRGLPVVMTFHNYRLVCANAMLFRDGRPCEDCVGGSLLPGVLHRCYRNSTVLSSMVAVTIHAHRRLGTWTDSLSAAIALTDFAKERLLEGGLPPDRTIVKPNFVVDPGPRMKDPSASNRVLFVGRLSAEKGIGPLVEAWHSVNPEGLELVIVGSGPQEEEIRRIAGGSVQVVGRLGPDEVKAEMLAARALMVPSVWYEGQPMVILESLAAGLPVWHSDLGALTETVGRGGQSLGNGGRAEMEAAIERLKHDDYLDELGARARLEYEHRYRPEHAVNGLTSIYSLARGGQ